ncbi:hypothetical protein [Actinomadura decatromicini]|uniref:DUF3060 domain-containing protein n=1 Tax=Actinomadura decatromicini TaxID=2604572 RepID=A0A5D3FFH4_9ACTN|nr:hypothetical protein [Actinomadura decatromicini]TYK46732.1 hypothetical protein FXF68_23050 [Actinomadura decatromicini]
MVRSASFVAVLALGGALLVSGCQSNSYSCKNGVCHVTVSGAGQTVDLDDSKVTVSEIGDRGVTVSADGSAPTTIAVGDTARIGRVQITVTSIDGEKVKFDLR